MRLMPLTNRSHLVAKLHASSNTRTPLRPLRTASLNSSYSLYFSNSFLFSVATTRFVDSIRLPCCTPFLITTIHENCLRCDGWRLRPEKYDRGSCFSAESAT